MTILQASSQYFGGTDPIHIGPLWGNRRREHRRGDHFAGLAPRPHPNSNRACRSLPEIVAIVVVFMPLAISRYRRAASR